MVRCQHDAVLAEAFEDGIVMNYTGRAVKAACMAEASLSSQGRTREKRRVFTSRPDAGHFVVSGLQCVLSEESHRNVQGMVDPRELPINGSTQLPMASAPTPARFRKSVSRGRNSAQPRSPSSPTFFTLSTPTIPNHLPSALRFLAAGQRPPAAYNKA